MVMAGYRIGGRGTVQGTAAVGGKAVLLRLVLEWAIVGDDEPVTDPASEADRSGWKGP
jgi:hypothetical protein